MTRRPAPRAVSFDWGGTLTPWRTVDVAAQWRAYVEHFAPAPGAASEGPDCEHLVRRLVAAESRAWALARGEGRSARMVDLLAEAGLAPEHPAHAVAREAHAEFWEPHTVLDPQVPALFAGLRERGLRIGVLSNTLWDRAFHDRMFARDGVLHLIDAAVYSSEIPHAKPHPAAFAAVLAALGEPDPAACLHVGDRPYEDVFGAQRAGLRGVLLPNPDLPVDQLVQVDGEPDAVLGDLLDLLDVVDAWLG